MENEEGKNPTEQEESLISPYAVTLEDRTPDNNILPEKKEGIIRELMEILFKSVDKINVTEIGRMYGVNRDTARVYIRLAIDRKISELPDQIAYQKVWAWEQAKALEHLPPNCSRVEQIRNVAWMFERINRLNEVSPHISDGVDSAGATFTIRGRISPETIEALATLRKRKIIQQDGTNSISQ